MSIDKPLHASVFWQFQGGASFVDPILLFMLHVSLYCAILSIPCGYVVVCWHGLAPCVWCFLVFLLLSHGVWWCDAWLYQFLICAFFFSLNNKLFV